MSRINDILKEKCPDGVEYKSIGSLITRVRTKGKTCKDATQVYVVSNTMGIVRSEDYHNNEVHSEDTSNYTVIKQGMFAYNPARLNIGSLGVLKKKETGLVSPMYVVFSVDENIVLQEYMLLNLKSSFVKNKIESLKEEGARFRFDYERWDKIEIPVPPIEVQQEIVRILDKFTELEAELQVELDARKKQYEYYRDRLFVFKNNVEYKNILNVISMKARVGWQALTKKEYLTTGEYYLITGTDFREDGCIEFDSCVYVSEERYDMDDNIKVHVNDILMTKDGTLGKVAFMEQEPPKSATLNGGVYRLTVKAEEVLPKYIYHYFTSYEFKCFIEKVKTGGTIKHLTQKWFETLEVPVPPIKKQEEIVRILDTFSAFCNSRVSGLPAEIAARHKQYEYYRDKLLTFKRKEV